MVEIKKSKSLTDLFNQAKSETISFFSFTEPVQIAIKILEANIAESAFGKQLRMKVDVVTNENPEPKTFLMSCPTSLEKQLMSTVKDDYTLLVGKNFFINYQGKKEHPTIRNRMFHSFFVKELK